jgi:hypothetical protein
MAIKLGPVLNFRGCGGGAWKVSVLIATDNGAVPALRLNANGQSSSPAAKRLAAYKTDRGELTAWRYDCELQQGPAQTKATYEIGGTSWSFAVPALGAPPAMAYASCNGFSSLKLLKNTKVPNALWARLNEKHAQTPYHLLLLGGDQLYSDSMWEQLDSLSAWATLPTDEGVKRAPSETMKRQIGEFFRGLYPDRWSQKDPAQAFATIPTVMMWDDHDILDGWGSYPEQLQQCKVYAAIFASARESFALYQQQSAPGERHPLVLAGQAHFSLGFQVGPVALLAPDLRSERSETQVMSPASWNAVYEWLGALPAADAPGGVKHLFVMSSIPVVHPDFSMLENALGLFPGQQELEDDLRDHWTSVPHRQERLRLIHRLLGFATDKNCRVTLLSGDVHVGAVGVVRSGREDAEQPSAQVINQLTSSGIVHPPAPGMVLFFLENVAGKSMSDDRDIASELIEIPGTRNHFIGARNYLTLEPDAEARYWANWHTERDKYPYTKVIHPVGFKLVDPKPPD